MPAQCTLTLDWIQQLLYKRGSSLRMLNGSQGPPEKIIDITELSRLLKGEFIYKPATDISMNFDETLDKMVERGIMKISDETISVGPSKETFVFLCFLLWPFIATYWITSVGLYSLLPDRITNEKTFLDR